MPDCCKQGEAAETWQGRSALTACLRLPGKFLLLSGNSPFQTLQCKQALALLRPQTQCSHNKQPNKDVQASGCLTHVLLGV